MIQNILLLLSSIKYIQVNFTNTPVLLSIVINFKPQFAHLFFKRKYTEQQIYNRLCKNRFQDYTKNLMMSNNAITQGGSLCLARSKIAIESMKKDLQLNNRYYSLIHELFARKCETLAQKLDVDKKDTDGYLWFENSNKKERQELINNLIHILLLLNT